MVSHETINQRYSAIQQLLRETFQVDGRGVVEIIRALEPPLPYELSLELRLVALIRNQVMHEGRTEVPRYFDALCKSAIAALKQIQKEKKAAARPVKKETVAKPKATTGRKVRSKPVRSAATKPAKKSTAKKKRAVSSATSKPGRGRPV